MTPSTADDDALAELTAATDAALVVVTTSFDGEPCGCLVGFHSQCSIEPYRYAVWLSKANRTYRAALTNEHLAVHLLGTADHDLADRFGGETGDEVDKFAGCAWTPGPHGVPLLDRLRHRFVGRRVALLDTGGDHVCAVLEPEAVELGGEIRPLRLGAVGDVEPGHPDP
jgi:flavin reductase (DIM6/NTAB) family NADH-FMN oxidoreductase RutF